MFVSVLFLFVCLFVCLFNSLNSKLKLIHLLNGQDAKKSGAVHSRKEKALGRLITAFQYVRVASGKADERFFIRECSYGTRGNGFKLKNG